MKELGVTLSVTLYSIFRQEGSRRGMMDKPKSPLK